MPNPSSRLPGLDSLRALAILAVMLFHLGHDFPEAIDPIRRHGWMGVDLFFVLSGYLIGAQLLKSHRDRSHSKLWHFYRRRLYRILPAYLAVLALYLFVPAWREAPGLSPAWQFLTFTQNLFIDYAHNQAFSHAWSLSIEEQFYLVMPLLLLLLLPGRRLTLPKTVLLFAALVALGIGLRTWVFFHTLRPLGIPDAGLAYIEHIYYPTWTRMDGLLAGASLAAIERYRPAWWQRLGARGYTMLAAGLTLFAVALWLFNDRFESQTGAAMWGTFIGFPILALAFALIVLSSVSRNALHARVAIPGARLTATLAYSLYLSHKAVAHLAARWLPGLTEPGSWKTVATDTILCFAAAGLLHLLVERPFLLLRDRPRTSSRSASTEPPAALDPAI